MSFNDSILLYLKEQSTPFITFYLPQKHSTNHYPYCVIYLWLLFYFSIITHFNVTTTSISNAYASQCLATILNRITKNLFLINHSLFSYLHTFNFFFFRNNFVVAQTHDHLQQSLPMLPINTLTCYLEQWSHAYSR